MWFIIDDGYTHNNTCVLNGEKPNVYIIHVYVIYVIRWRGRWKWWAEKEALSIVLQTLKIAKREAREGGDDVVVGVESQDLVLDKEGHMRDIQLDWMAV